MSAASSTAGDSPWPALWVGAAIALLAAVAWWLWPVTEHSAGGRLPAAEARAPDFYLGSFSTVILDMEGRPSREIAAARLAHYPDTGESELVGPTLLLARVEGPPWHAWAEHGRLSADSQELLLQGRVYLWRRDADGAARSIMLTENLRVLPETGYGETQAAVTMLTRHARTTGVGMRASLTDDRLELDREARTSYRRDLYAADLERAVDEAESERAAVIDALPNDADRLARR